MMERLTTRLAEIAARRAKVRRIQVAAVLRDALPDDVAVVEDGDGIVAAGKRLGIRWLRDPAFAVLRAGFAWTSAQPERVDAEPPS